MEDPKRPTTGPTPPALPQKSTAVSTKQATPPQVAPSTSPQTVEVQGGNQQGFFNIFFGGKQASQPAPNGMIFSTLFFLTSIANRTENRIVPTQQAPQRSTSPRGYTPNSAPIQNIPERRIERLEPVPATIKPINTPTDKEQFETELISKRSH